MNKFKQGDRVQHVNELGPRIFTVVGYGPDGTLYGVDGIFANPATLSEDYFELVSEPRKISGWMNLYENATHSFHETRSDADVFLYSRTACIYVSGTEGVEPESDDTR